MKISILIIGFCVGSILGCKTKQEVGANGVSYKSASEYNDYIMVRQRMIVEDVTKYANAMKINTNEAEKQLYEVIATARKIFKDVKGMPAYNNDSAFREATINLFAFYKKSFSTDFIEIIKIRKKIDSAVQTDDDMLRLNFIQEKVSNAEMPLDQKMKEAQRNFAKNNNLRLTDNTLQEQIDKIKK